MGRTRLQGEAGLRQNPRQVTEKSEEKVQCLSLQGCLGALAGLPPEGPALDLKPVVGGALGRCVEPSSLVSFS